MKKFLPLVLAVFVAVIIAAVFFVQKRLATVTVEIPSVLPAETMVFMQLPNIPGTREAWHKTSLSKMADETDVAAYFKLVETAIPYFETTKAKLEEISNFDPIQAFIAIIDDAPTVIAGFEFSGERSDVEVLLNEAKAKLQEIAPSGRLDIAMHAGHEVQMFHFRDKTLVGSFHQRWYLMANSVDLLEKTLDGLVSSNASNLESLANNPDFQKSLLKIPQNPDALLFVQTESLIDRFLTLLSVSGQKISASNESEIRKVRAFAASTKFEGQNVRDSTFVLKPGEKAGEPLEKSALAFTTAQTQLFYASKLEIPDQIELPDTSLDSTGVLRVFNRIVAAFESKGFRLNEIKKAFGPEIGTMLGWREDQTGPSVLMVLDVKDFETAKRLLDAAAENQVVGVTLNRREIEGGVFYSIQQKDDSWFPNPSIALSNKFAVIGFSLEDIIEGLERTVSGKGGIMSSASFDRASSSVITPTQKFAYVDTSGLFDRIYKLAYRFLSTWAILETPGNPLMDLSKLPSVDSIAKHLGPMVYSQAEVEDGLVTESVGPMTVSQSLIVAAVGVGAAIYPIVKQQLEDGTLLPSGESFRGLSHNMPTSPTPSQISDSKSTELPKPEQSLLK